MTQPATRSDVWAAGDAYEPYVGRWSRLVAQQFISWLNVKHGRDWLDVGCGTGALTQAILDLARPKSVLGVDPSQGFLDYAQKRVKVHDVSFRLAVKPTVNFKVADARSLPVADRSVDAVVSGLVLNFVPEPEVAVAEMVRAARKGGTVAIYVWDYAGKMDVIRHFWDAATLLDDAAVDQDEGRRFPLCNPAPLKELFTAAGLKDVDVRSIDVPAQFRDFDDYWTPFLGGQGPAPSYVATIDESRRETLRYAIEESLPIRRDGSIRMTARAWAVKGRA